MLSTKLGGSTIRFALYASLMFNLPAPASCNENSVPYASETGFTVVSSKAPISCGCNCGFFSISSAAAPLTWGAA